MIMTTICGFVQLYLPCGMYKQPIHRSKRPPNFYIHMCLVGCTRQFYYVYIFKFISTNDNIYFFSYRFITVLLGLISLNYVAVSFTETIKSSAPIFTVFISKLLLGMMNIALIYTFCLRKLKTVLIVSLSYTDNIYYSFII